jgi:hypothetical protein
MAFPQYREFRLAGPRGDGRHAVATFASFADSLRAFVGESGSVIQGVSDPVSFASALQNSRKYGIDTKTGLPVPGYVSRVAATIRSLRPFIAPGVF